MKRIQQLSAAAGATPRDRTKSAGRCVLQIGRICRSRTEQGKDRLQQCYRRLPSITGRVVGSAKRVVHEVVTGIKGSAELIAQLALEEYCVYLETMIPRVRRVMRRARERTFGGDTRSAGKMVKIQEAERQIVMHYDVYDERPSDSDLLMPAVQVHEQQFGRPPRLVTADAGFFSARNEAAARERGVKRLAIRNFSTKNA